MGIIKHLYIKYQLEKYKRKFELKYMDRGRRDDILHYYNKINRETKRFIENTNKLYVPQSVEILKRSNIMLNFIDSCLKLNMFSTKVEKSIIRFIEDMNEINDKYEKLIEEV